MQPRGAADLPSPIPEGRESRVMRNRISQVLGWGMPVLSVALAAGIDPLAVRARSTPWPGQYGGAAVFWILWGVVLPVTHGLTHVEISRDGLVVVNPVSRMWIGWPAVIEVTADRSGTAVRLRDGGLVRVWGFGPEGGRIESARERLTARWTRDHPGGVGSQEVTRHRWAGTIRRWPVAVLALGLGGYVLVGLLTL